MTAAGPLKTGLSFSVLRSFEEYVSEAVARAPERMIIRGVDR